ncbi:unnamed protein product [Phytomonas sp. Hart1]|nr:unnamed protein product [Phytomonas sp. Hart1]|eukprot:CCW71209.1 unnamed protein product [Phytomonas sp. isolate Hart1]
MEDEIVRAQCELAAHQIFFPTFLSSASASSPSSAHCTLNLSTDKKTFQLKSNWSGVIAPVGLCSSAVSVQNILKDAASMMSDDAIALYRLCRHRAVPIALSHGGSSGYGLNTGDGNTSLQDAAFCVCARLIVKLPLLWEALTYRAAVLRPRNPILWFGKLVLVSVSVSDIQRFAARSHHLMLSCPVLFCGNHKDDYYKSGICRDGGNSPSAPASSIGVGSVVIADVATNNIATSPAVETFSASPLSKASPVMKVAPAALTAGALNIDPTQIECLAACYFFTVTTPALRKKYPQVVEARPLNHEGNVQNSSDSAGGAKKHARAGKYGETKKSLPLFVDDGIANRFTSNVSEVSATSFKDKGFCRQMAIEGICSDENSEGDPELGGNLERDGTRKRLLAESLASRSTKKRKLTRSGIARPLYSDLHLTKMNRKADTKGNDNDSEVNEDEVSNDDIDEGLNKENIEQVKWNKLCALLMRTNDSELQNGEALNGLKLKPASPAPALRSSALWDSSDCPLNVTELAAQVHVTALITRRKRIEALLRRPQLYGFRKWSDLYSSVHNAYGDSSDGFPCPGLSNFSSSVSTLKGIRLSTEKYENQTLPVVDINGKFNVNDVLNCAHPTCVRSFWNLSVSNTSTSTFMLPSLMPRPASLTTCDYLWMRLLICAMWLTVYADVLLPKLADIENNQKIPTSPNSELFADSKSQSVTTFCTTIHEKKNSHNSEIMKKKASRDDTETILDRDPSEEHASETEKRAYDTHHEHASTCIAFCIRIIKAERKKYGGGSKRGSNRSDRGSSLLCPVCDEALHNSTQIKSTWSALREDREMLWKRIHAFMEVMRTEGCVSPSDSSDAEDKAEIQHLEKSGGLETEAFQLQDSTSLVCHEGSAKHRISLRTWWNLFVRAVSAREVVESTLRYYPSPSSRLPTPPRSPTCTNGSEGAVASFSEIDSQGKIFSIPQNEARTTSNILGYTNEELINVQNCFFKAVTHRMQAVVEELCILLFLSSKDSSTEEILVSSSRRNNAKHFPSNVPHDKEGIDGNVSCLQLSGLKSSCFGAKTKASLWITLLEKYRWLHRESVPKTAPLNKAYASQDRSKTSDNAVMKPFSFSHVHDEEIIDYLQGCSLRQLVLEVVLGGCSVKQAAPLLFPFLCSYPKSDVTNGQGVAPLPEHYRKQQQRILELLDFIPSIPALKEEDGVLECAQCLTLFHQHCVGPFQRDFFMGYFLCHTCRLLMPQKP